MQGCGICGNRGTWFPGTFFLPGTFYEQMKSAWKSTEVKDLIGEPHVTKKCVYLGIAQKAI